MKAVEEEEEFLLTLTDGKLEAEGIECVQMASSSIPQQQTELKQVLQCFQPLFSNVLGKTYFITHHINTGIYPPVKSGLYSLDGPKKEIVPYEAHHC